MTEASLNGFASNLIAEKIRQDPYRFLVCADKFQTGYDEPLLHSMYGFLSQVLPYTYPAARRYARSLLFPNLKSRQNPEQYYQQKWA